ncbi:pilus assembly protein PilP [Arenimonas sp. MALMAid1274]|uniref:pilus assembly protein PilP n=1 Tax=Arenimonas sp. MALMAid1274 TaxID=3411630 RepID=UPI003BA0D34D
MTKNALLILLLAILLPLGNAGATRQKEALERYSLPSLSYWLFSKDVCGDAAYVLDADGYAHRVIVGSYIGRNQGRISKITEQAIELVELYPDGEGGLYEKTAQIEFAN